MSTTETLKKKNWGREKKRLKNDLKVFKKSKKTTLKMYIFTSGLMSFFSLFFWFSLHANIPTKNIHTDPHINTLTTKGYSDKKWFSKCVIKKV